jgi:hypothetical protein
MSAVSGNQANSPGATISYPDGYTICGDFICAPNGGHVAIASGGGAIMQAPGLILMGAAGVVGAADIAAGESGVLFGTVRNGLEGGGLFNRSDYFRVGWSALRSGGARFRLGGDLIEDIFGTKHINLWPPSWWFGPPLGK